MRKVYVSKQLGKARKSMVKVLKVQIRKARNLCKFVQLSLFPVIPESGLVWKAET